MTITAIIPARGGSKGIPRKNLVNVCGKPLIVWSIEQALAASSVDRVIVATDDDEIATVSRAAGSEVYRRSPASATDTEPSESVLTEAITRLRLIQEEAIVFLQATSPCRVDGEIGAAIETLRTNGADSVISARHVEGYVWRKSLHGDCVRAFKEPRLPRQQQSVTTLEENGSIYVFRPMQFLRDGSRCCGKCVPHIMHPLDSFQVDEPADIELLERCMEVRIGCHATASA